MVEFMGNRFNSISLTCQTRLLKRQENSSGLSPQQGTGSSLTDVPVVRPRLKSQFKHWHVNTIPQCRLSRFFESNRGLPCCVHFS